MLIGVGLGPGDPELLTLKAIRLLREADAVFVPGMLAHRLVEPYRPDAERLEFPMTGDEEKINDQLRRHADRIAPVARGGSAVFGILGDPNFFSTFTRLCRVLETRYPDISCRTVPGISSITAGASVARFPVSGGVLVSDGSPVTSAICLKVRRPREIATRLEEEGFPDCVLVEKMGMPAERVYHAPDLPEESDYFSIMYARKRNGEGLHSRGRTG
ncbi:MAG: cobalt-factor II C(20)-methyltransferase [Methanoculleaceae archaeon]